MCIPHSFISFDCCLLLSICVFISLCVASVALALVFMPGLYPTAYRATFPAFFMRLPLKFVSTVCVFLFVFSILSRRYPLLATFLSVLFCPLSLLTSDSRFDLGWFRLSCDHGWIRSGSVYVRKTTTNNNRHLAYRVLQPVEYPMLCQKGCCDPRINFGSTKCFEDPESTSI